jgi:spore germination protein YaaH
MRIVYFYSSYNKSTLSFIPELLRFFEIDERVRIILINYDSKNAPTTDIIDEIEDAHKFEFYSIDSGNLNNKHLQKYALNVLPKMMVVNKKGNGNK